MGDVILILLSLFAVLVLSGFLYVNHIYSYWKRKSIAYLKPTFPFGSSWDNILQKTSIAEQTAKQHNSTNEPVLGFYAALRPALLIRDPEIIRSILIKDFPSFYHRGLYSDEKIDPLTGSLLLLNGERWRNLRSKLSPAFTSGKLKGMFSTLIDCGDSLQKHVAHLADTQQLIEVRDVSARYSTNVIASVAFGIDVDCIREPDSEFRENGKKFFEMTLSNALRQAGSFLCPSLMSFFHIRMTDKKVEDFMKSVVKENLEYREKNNIVRKDFFQLLMQLRNSGTISQSDDDWKTQTDQSSKQKHLTLNEMTAQSFIFFTAGFETTSTTISFCLYELSRASEIQRKVHDEIDSVLSKYDGKLTYDAMNEMKYLECCIDGNFSYFHSVFVEECYMSLLKMPIPIYRDFEKKTTIGNAAETMHSRLQTG